METVYIRFLNEDLDVEAASGSTLLEIQVAAGMRPDAPCGGQGSCGKCLVDIRRPGEARFERVKACQTRATGPLEVRTVHPRGSIRVLTEGVGDAERWEPWVEKTELSVPACPNGESTADWLRLKKALGAAVGQETWAADIALASHLGDLLRKTAGRVYAVTDRSRVLDLLAEDGAVYLAAFDLGTTSIAGYLLSADRHEVAATRGMLNPQSQYGADVIMRADYALAHGAHVLADCARGAIDELLGQLCADAGVARESVYAVSVVGNTCMHHLFLGISPDSLVHAPYNPAISEPLELRAADYGVQIHPNGTLLMLPVVAGFVGADTVGCLLAMDWEHRDELTLMIDIGTNGEIVMGDRRRMMTCSTAAGPAFEGAKIQCGMRGADGAVDHVYLRGGHVSWHVIGEGEAVGLCGSGLIDLVAVLRRIEEIDDSGKLVSGPEYRLGDTKVVLTQRDVREVQLAKGAISAGIRLLAQQLGVELEDIRRVCIAGAFGSYMDVNSACDIGLIPGELRGKIQAIGNAAGEGAKLALQNRGQWDRAARLARQAEFLELAALPQFQDEFVDALEFPELEGATC